MKSWYKGEFVLCLILTSIDTTIRVLVSVYNRLLVGMGGGVTHD